MTDYKPNIKPETRLFWTPDEVATNWVVYAKQEREEMQRGDGLNWGVRSVDSVVRPLGLGKIWAIVARPGHGKSTSAMYLARKYAQTIVASGRENEIVVYITLDQPVEELETMVQSEPGITTEDVFWGRAEVEKMERKAIHRVNLPLWFMGKSMVERRSQPRMTTDNMYSQIREIETKFRKRPALIVIDYIQHVPVDGKKSRTDEVTEATYKARELVMDLQTRMIVCVQASRAVDDRDNKVPQIQDCQHASAIEQEADVIFGITRPILTETEKTLPCTIKGRDVDLPITDNLFVMGNGKQRGGKPARMFYLHFDPILVKLSDLELEGEMR